MKKKYHSITRVVAGIALGFSSVANAMPTDASPAQTAQSTPFSSLDSIAKTWWNGNSALGNWFGLGYPLNDHGLSITGTAKEGFYGIAAGGLPNLPKGTWGGEGEIEVPL
jgi:hypothetical protein